MEKYFYVRPTNSILLEENQSVSEISLDDIKLLALFALSLKENINITSPLEYIASLNEFYANNENELKTTYTKLSISHFGMTFLSTNIKLAILENLFRENGIDEKLTEVYNNELTEYYGQLDLNKAMFAPKMTI